MVINCNMGRIMRNAMRNQDTPVLSFRKIWLALKSAFVSAERRKLHHPVLP